MDWTGFLNDHQIEYVTRGPNTAKDHVSIRCPWCADEDPSQHLGISLNTEAWGCLRNAAHRGHSASRLIAALLGCSTAEAKLIETQYSKADPDALPTLEASWRHAPEPTSEELPTLWHITRTGSSAKYWNYLKKRGFASPTEVIERYHLKCCLLGRFKDRLIIPFYRDHHMIAWTGRAIAPVVQAPRYLSSKLVKTTIFNEDELRTNGKGKLFIVEGPFDALKLDLYGQQYGARATCVFGTAMSMDQIVILNALRKRFKRVVVLFDVDAIGPTAEATEWLRGAEFGSLPEGIKDPGDLSEQQIKTLALTPD